MNVSPRGPSLTVSQTALDTALGKKYLNELRLVPRYYFHSMNTRKTNFTLYIEEACHWGVASGNWPQVVTVAAAADVSLDTV